LSYGTVWLGKTGTGYGIPRRPEAGRAVPIAPNSILPEPTLTRRPYPWAAPRCQDEKIAFPL